MKEEFLLIKDSLWWGKRDKMMWEGCHEGVRFVEALMKQDQGVSIVTMSCEQFLLCRDLWIGLFCMNKKFFSRYFSHLEHRVTAFVCAPAFIMSRLNLGDPWNGSQHWIAIKLWIFKVADQNLMKKCSNWNQSSKFESNFGLHSNFASKCFVKPKINKTQANGAALIMMFVACGMFAHFKLIMEAKLV